MGQAAKPAFWAVRVAEKEKAHAYSPSIRIFNCMGVGRRPTSIVKAQRAKGKGQRSSSTKSLCICLSMHSTSDNSNSDPTFLMETMGSSHIDVSA